MRTLFLAASTLALFSVSAAHAGGFAAPVVDVAPVAPVVVTESPAWQGGYVGAALGYAFGGDDEIGASVGGTVEGNLGNAELGGPNLSLRAGYRWQRNNWVVGPELSYTAGDISDEFDYGTAGTFESKVNNTLAIKLKTGYLVQPDMLVYGIAGWQKGDFTYTNSGTDIDYDADGYVVGLGAEKMLSDRMSVTGEYEYSNFGNTEVDLGGGITTRATPEFSNIKLGLNFKF